MQTEIRPGVVNTIFQKFMFLITLITCVSFFCGTTVAQSSRAEELADIQAEKAKTLTPYAPNKGERILSRLQNYLEAPHGLYPFLASTYPSGGLALGVGYRSRFGDSGWWDVHGAYSIKSYKMLDATVHLPEVGLGLLKTDINAHYVDAPQVRFFGLGNDTDKEDETNYGLEPISFSVTETVTPVNWFAFGGGIDYLKYTIDEGSASTSPSIEERFNFRTAPGLGFDEFTYLRPRAFAQIDYRNGITYATSGGFYRVDWAQYSERDLDGFDFDRIDAEVNQFIPLLRANWVIALRGLVSTTNVDDGDLVPFFLLPSLGGGSELRGYPNFRFTDRHRMLLTAEYRWTASKFMDMAIFYEAGKVTRDRSDLDLEDLQDSYGIGARFHAPKITALRIELARSKEGTRIIFSASPSF